MFKVALLQKNIPFLYPGWSDVLWTSRLLPPFQFNLTFFTENIFISEWKFKIIMLVFEVEHVGAQR